MVGAYIWKLGLSFANFGNGKYTLIIRNKSPFYQHYGIFSASDSTKPLH